MDDDFTPYSLPKGSETILVAEDNETLRTLLQIALSSCGYTVLAGASGPEALALAGRHGEPIALLISDVVMPGMDGPELARRLAAIRPRLQVLLLSGYGPDDALLDSGIHFLQKPFRPSVLVATVREILDLAPATPQPRGAQESPSDEPPPRAARHGHAVEACESCGLG
jgi:two-component system cell cycle sensor histidine kinase/response regulator CckA